MALDLRVLGQIPILVTKGINYPAITFTFTGGNMPSNFTIIMEGWNAGADAIFSVGSGLSINGNVLTWNLG